VVSPQISVMLEHWPSLTLRDEHGLRVLEYRVPRKIFGPRRDEITEKW